MKAHEALLTLHISALISVGKIKLPLCNSQCRENRSTVNHNLFKGVNEIQTYFQHFAYNLDEIRLCKHPQKFTSLVLGKAHNETQATQVYVIHTFECVSAS
jgi:hypothetical protein